MRIFLSVAVALSLVTGCGSDGSPSENGGGAGAGGAAAFGGSGSGAVAGAGAVSGTGAGGAPAGTAQVRFLYEADWKDHIGTTCSWISDYRIKFGANPVPVTALIDVMDGSLGQYVSVDGRTYEDADVLHIFSCSKSQTSKSTLQLFGRFGTDLPLEASKHYTVTLGGSVATVAEDP